MEIIKRDGFGEIPTKTIFTGSLSDCKLYLVNLQQQYECLGFETALHLDEHLEISKNYNVGKDDEYEVNFNFHII